MRWYIEIVSSALGLFLLSLSIRNWWRVRLSRHWPSAPGRINRSFVLVTSDSDGNVSYTPQVEYDYTVEGTAYRGTLLQSGQLGSSNRARAEQAIAPYPADTTVPVFYDPRRPAIAVLVRGTSWGNLAIAAGGLIFLACAFTFGPSEIARAYLWRNVMRPLVRS